MNIALAFANGLAAALLLMSVSSSASDFHAETSASGAIEKDSVSVGFDETGMASWYGDELAGKRTASGEAFDPTGLTAAHRSLPMGTLIEVTEVETQRSIVVRVNDRGPFSKGRLIDLSHGAARELGIDRKGVAKIGLRVLDVTAGRVPSTDADHPGYVVQVAIFPKRASAEILAQSLGGNTVQHGETLWQVQLGPFDDGNEASEGLNLAQQNGYEEARILLATDR